MKKFKIEILVAVIIALGGGGFWGVAATGPERKAKAETQRLIDFAQRQALEIAIIEQSVKLTKYKKQIAESQNPAPVSVEPIPFLQSPIIPITPDPKDIE